MPWWLNLISRFRWWRVLPDALSWPTPLLIFLRIVLVILAMPSLTPSSLSQKSCTSCLYLFYALDKFSTFSNNPSLILAILGLCTLSVVGCPFSIYDLIIKSAHLLWYTLPTIMITSYTHFYLKIYNLLNKPRWKNHPKPYHYLMLLNDEFQECEH